ncbi:Arylsulfatase A [Fodinibius roseus]|uniref:Arylsulfatase A n=2 Tax=Fodinibius roseus TaxID=1194090 RepID=A0A1M4TUP5_9BACT|nr:Arylsulfatase A [Fodinibius roseus]
MNRIFMTSKISKGKKNFLKSQNILGTCLALLVLLQACNSVQNKSNGSEQGQRPNILIISIDNLGYGDFRTYNEASPIVTPNIDKLASQGVRFTRFYSAPTCAVARAQLLTGRYPHRNKLTWQLPGMAGNYGIGLPQSEIIIPRMLETSSAGYATGVFGKWNVGFAPGSRPTDRGFDEFLGNASGNIDYFSHVYGGMDDLYHNTESINRKGEYTTDLYADTAIDFIREKTERSNPWFVYLPFNAPHRPASKNVTPGEAIMRQAPDYAFEPYDFGPDVRDPQKRYNAVVTAMDRAVGRVMESLDSLGIADNTFVFLYSDNGGFSEPVEAGDQTNAPLRGYGNTYWEGGIRVPAFARWPGKIKPNSVIDVPLWSGDLFVAAAELAGADLPRDRVIDGKNPLPVMTGETEHSPHSMLYWGDYRGHQALHRQGWKIIRESPDSSWQLYNLQEDISESNDLASKRPELVERLSRSFDEKQEEIEHDLMREADTLDTSKLPLRLR